MITVGADDFDWHEGLTVAALLEELKKKGMYLNAIDVPGTIVALNAQIVPTDEYSTRLVEKGDTIHLVSFLAGG